MPNTPLRRRCFLKALGGTVFGKTVLGGAVLGSAVVVPPLARAASVSDTLENTSGLPLARSLQLENLHTGESVATAFWTPQGYQPDALQAINKVLRDHRADQATEMDIGLLETLVELTRRLDTQAPVQVISAYRSPQTNEMLRRKGHKVAKRSYHLKGQAVDIRIPGVELKDLHRAALSLKRGGVGFYGRSNFVHLDVGPVRRWG
ncbi:MAG: DUF882 domain-containing protein [Marinobacterium sp.]|nr:DUF882 domain-containing protein [Marinobacterium sp.]